MTTPLQHANGELKDPVCGMTVLPDRSLTVAFGSELVHFCSEYCRDKFLAHPAQYRATAQAAAADDAQQRRIAYFSMEVAVAAGMPSYSGGLGVLAGDTLRSCADLRVPIVGVTLLYGKGYFDQRLDEHGGQQETPVNWDPRRFVQPLSASVEVEIERRLVRVGAWQYDITGADGYRVPLILLDTNVPPNSDDDRALTAHLYGGDQRYRFAQELLLGIGGVRMLRALGYVGVEKFHMNEGHASLLALELLGGCNWAHDAQLDFESVRKRCVFTTHTPVSAGHDQFDYDLAQRMLPATVPSTVLRMLAGGDRLNMTLLGLNLSHYVNGVAKRHGEVSRGMFPGYPIHDITNGVHSGTWTCDSFRRLYDEHLPGWANDPAMLRQALGIPAEALWAAHTEAKTRLLSLVRERTGVGLHSDALTIGFARRATAYKRADLVFWDLDRLVRIAAEAGPLQFVFAGKAHPNDYAGKELIRRIVGIARETVGAIPIVYLENHDMELAKILVSGADLWLNTPQRPLEASGTSGMKAAHNGVPSFSTFDGWWLEGHLEGVTGWSIGAREADPADADAVNRQDADDLYRKLERDIVPMFYQHREQWIHVMRHAIALNASYFNTHRMVQQYAIHAYVS